MLIGVQWGAPTDRQAVTNRRRALGSGAVKPFADRHDVRLVSGGVFARLFDRETIRVYSLHGRGIPEPGDRVVVEGVAKDGTIADIRIADAPGFASGVQRHAGHGPQTNPVNRALFRAIGKRKRAQ